MFFLLSSSSAHVLQMTSALEKKLKADNYYAKAAHVQGISYLENKKVSRPIVGWKSHVPHESLIMGNSYCGTISDVMLKESGTG